MSIFRTTEIPCPACKTPVSFELVHSVNAGRRADLRTAILDRSFQKQPCPACGFAFRVEPQFTYMDLGRGQFFAVWPAENVADWPAHEKRSQQAFDTAFGTAAPPEAQVIGKKLSTRAVFGWAGLNEKLIVAEAGIDDHTLEVAKVGVIRNLDEAPVAGNSELRLLGVEPESLVLGWFRIGSADLAEVVRVPKAILAEIDAAPAAWQALRDDLTAGPFVDYRRLVIGPAETRAPVEEKTTKARKR
jgi:hypothetical protein